MHVYIHIIYMCVYVYIYMYICIYVYIYMYTCIYISKNTPIHAYIHACINTDIQFSTFMASPTKTTLDADRLNYPYPPTTLTQEMWVWAAFPVKDRSHTGPYPTQGTLHGPQQSNQLNSLALICSAFPVVHVCCIAFQHHWLQNPYPQDSRRFPNRNTRILIH